jgi:hypothetical protein
MRHPYPCWGSAVDVHIGSRLRNASTIRQHVSRNIQVLKEHTLGS